MRKSTGTDSPAPSDFISYPADPGLYWGDKVECEAGTLHLAWTEEEGLEIDTEVAATLTPKALDELIDALLFVRARVLSIDIASSGDDTAGSNE